jgi:predicted phage terminase large subunit-like protein
MTAAPTASTEEISAALCRKSLKVFVQRSWHVLEPSAKLIWNWHLDVICDQIQNQLEQWAAAQKTPEIMPEIQNLLVNVPPGSAKSRIISVCAPAWAWTRWSWLRIIAISANPRVAMRDSTFCRTLIESEWYQQTFRPHWKMAEDQNAKGHYCNTAGGSRIAIGVGSKLTGDRADWLIVDDPHDADEINSDTIRVGVTDWWDSTAYSRVNDMRKSIRTAIMQRLHEEDYSGHVLAHGGWHHLCIQQEYDPEAGWKNQKGYNATPIQCDPRTEPGQLMFPERMPAHIVAGEKRRLGSAGYAGQYQQLPAPADGLKFKKAWFLYYELIAGINSDPTTAILHTANGDLTVSLSALTRFATVDTAFSTKESADYTVIAEWGVLPTHQILLLSLERGHWEDPEVERRIRATIDRVGYACVEEKMNGASIIQRLRQDGKRVVALKADTDKGTRATLAAIDFENGRVFLPKGAPWLGEYEHELLTFPAGTHDDQVDVTAYAAIKSGEMRGMNTWLAPDEIETPNGLRHTLRLITGEADAA